MSWPLGDTGVGKMGTRRQAPRRSRAEGPRAEWPMATAARVSPPSRRPVYRRQEARLFARKPPSTRIRNELGRIQGAPIRRHLKPFPDRRLPALRAEDAQVSGPLPQRRLQALALELRRVGGVQGVARRR